MPSHKFSVEFLDSDDLATLVAARSAGRPGWGGFGSKHEVHRLLPGV